MGHEATRSQTSKTRMMLYTFVHALKTKACSCMTMAKTGGVCACGSNGGPALKAVPGNSDWAKEKRDALAKCLRKNSGEGQLNRQQGQPGLF